ncbi:hypothetical protein GPUN_2045 [Glaciecola punicea ACAM 611]|jgi:hypothetical protein|uniref:Uncharacterized protein n=1 Tax=Glaciecola punicea ACAM 611 TaxID=1121923 RepID=H5TCY3_9ALTE|nr:hypothetical protein [Glaciecola punicea]OFA30398.1 hypothetical protein BAE46_11680 [Glaciecola punicea]GAB56160.1 hypothetical protein GPUN_2045 [Glaciecola punicea ACAM 611]
MTDSNQHNDSANATNKPASHVNTAHGAMDELNHNISARIYQRFTQGRVITKLSYNKLKSQHVEDKDYTYLFRYVDAFTLLYKLIGKELEYNAKGEFFYINNFADSEIDEADEHALRTQSILLILGRYFEMSGRNIDSLSLDSLGFNNKDIEALGESDEYKSICRALKFANWQKAIEYLVNRGFAFDTSSNHYFLSSAGKTFLDAVIQAHENL